MPQPDMNVDVTCDTTTNPATFTFTPPSVTLNASGKVILHRKPAQATWTFQTAEVKDDILQEFQPSVLGNGSLLQINDLFKDLVKKTYHYNVTVLSGGNSFKSPDPDIVNDPGLTKK